MSQIVFIPRMEASFRFGFITDAKNIPKFRRGGNPLPPKFAPAVKLACGEVVAAKRGERYHADIVLRVSDPEPVVEGYVYERTG